MAYTTGKAVRADDGSGLNIATKSETSEDAVTKHFQRVIVEDGTTIGQQLAINASGQITIASIAGALPAGTAAIGKLAANTGVDIGDVDVLTLPNVTLAAGTNTNEIVGDVADDAVAAGNPLQIAGIRKDFDGTDPGTVSAEGDAASLITDNNRRLYVNDCHPNFWNVSADYAAAQTNASIKAAPGAGLKLYITDIVISNGAVAGNITLLDGSGGTVKFEIYPAINGGVAITLKSPIALTANTALVITSPSCTTHCVNIMGYIAP